MMNKEKKIESTKNSILEIVSENSDIDKNGILTSFIGEEFRRRNGKSFKEIFPDCKSK